MTLARVPMTQPSSSLGVRTFGLQISRAKIIFAGAARVKARNVVREKRTAKRTEVLREENIVVVVAVVVVCVVTFVDLGSFRIERI